MKNSLIVVLLLASSLNLFAQSTAADQYESDVVRDWFSLELYLIQNGSGFTPPVAARALGFSGLALYESIVDGIDGRNSLGGLMPDFAGTSPTDSQLEYHWPTVANNAMALVLDSLFANASQAQHDSIFALRDAWNSVYQSQVNATVFANSKAHGELVAGEVFEFSRTDGGYQAYLSNFPASYVPPSGPGLWEPTPPNFQAALQPYWGDLRPFVLADTMAPSIPAAPPVYSTDTNSPFYAYAYQVYATVENLTLAQEHIAQYWADGPGTVTPPGHSVSMLTQIMELENSDLAFAAVAYAKLGMSQADAFVSCWRTKYKYNLVRPLTYINTYIDTGWTTVVGTPPFPEYTSGHSTQSGSMTAIMNDLFGTNYGFTDYTHGVDYGGPRSFGCFDEAAYEAALSRMFGGIHYEFSNVFALTLGKSVGENILQLFRDAQGPPASVDEVPLSAPSLSLSMYPNPATSFVMLTASGFKVGKVQVFDLAGRLVLETNNPYVLEVSSLPIGTYVLRAWDVDGIKCVDERLVRMQ